MEGNVTWAQAVFFIPILIAAAGSGYLVAWRLQVLRARDRHAVRSGFEQRMMVISEQISDYKDNMDKRISAIEHYNAGTIVVLEHLKEFRDEVKDQYARLVQQREDDMEGLHRRLDALHNTARFERIAVEDIRDGKK